MPALEADHAPAKFAGPRILRTLVSGPECCPLEAPPPEEGGRVTLVRRPTEALPWGRGADREERAD